jgi:hypothetical protein
MTGESDGLFTPTDLAQMAGLGIAPAEALRQIELFRNPPPFTQVERPCTVDDGIGLLPEAAVPGLLVHYEHAVRLGRIAKFVPASGAASRMFQGLLAALAGSATENDLGDLRSFLTALPRFAFYDALADTIANDGLALPQLLQEGNYLTILVYLLTEKGLNYAQLPKGLLLFHRYPDRSRTPFEEHLVEATEYACDGERNCRIDFTVSPEHEPGFSSLFEGIRARIEERYGANFLVSFSHQKHATNTLAVDLENRPFRLQDGSLLFRPGGHGSLLESLNSLAAQGWDIVLIKNIDNVVPDYRKPIGIHWQKLLAGALLALQERVFAYLEELDKTSCAPSALLAEVEQFVAANLSCSILADLRSAGLEGRRKFLVDRLDRPLRVCGLVRNTGEPGGGPFWVRSKTGDISPQLVEPPQIDPSPEQQEKLASSTHFNPVDIACSLRDRHGRPYDLRRYVDPSTAFISIKSHEGRPLKALEHPGLWNGGMAGWNTQFIEIPVATFTPVKTVFDLLRPEHQAL